MVATGRPIVVVTRRLPSDVEAALAERFDVRLNTRDAPLDGAALRDAMRTADALLCTVTDRLTADVFDVPDRRVQVVANFGVGVNHIDLAAARAAGVIVTNTPDVLTDATADLAITLMLMAMRRAGEGERELRAGAWTGWRPTHLLGAHVTGKTLGVVGFGRIGRATAHRAHHGFGMPVRWFSPGAPDGAYAALPYTRVRTLDDLLASCDVISLHCPATPATRHLIGAPQLARMRRTAVLVNTARGDVVDEPALAEALARGTIAGAGVDVYEREPTVHPALLAAPNAVLLPHLGSATTETRVAMGLRALANLADHFDGRPVRDRVA
jgi:lactate dehydrogenase-like 2-hydroxyacid dehydrogenase